MTVTLEPPAPELLDDLTRRRFISGSIGLGRAHQLRWR